jgi:acetate kinase
MQIRGRLEILPTLETACRKYGHQNMSHAFASDSAHKSMGTKYDK